MCYNSVREVSDLQIAGRIVLICFTVRFKYICRQKLSQNISGLNKEVQNGQKNLMGLPYALLFFC